MERRLSRDLTKQVASLILPLLPSQWSIWHNWHCLVLWRHNLALLWKLLYQDWVLWVRGGWRPGNYAGGPRRRWCLGTDKGPLTGSLRAGLGWVSVNVVMGGFLFFVIKAELWERTTSLPVHQAISLCTELKLETLWKIKTGGMGGDPSTQSRVRRCCVNTPVLFLKGWRPKHMLRWYCSFQVSKFSD